MTSPKSLAEIESKRLVVFVFCWLGSKDDSFITWWHGNFSDDADEFIKDLTAEEPESFFSKGPGEYLIRASWQPEQRSFPEYVDFPAYWEYDILDFKAAPEYLSDSAPQKLGQPV